MIDRCCSVQERDSVRCVVDSKAEFSRIWTMNKVYLKMRGTGIVQDLMTADTAALYREIEMQKINGCYIAVANENFGGDRYETNQTPKVNI